MMRRRKLNDFLEKPGNTVVPLEMENPETTAAAQKLFEERESDEDEDEEEDDEDDFKDYSVGKKSLGKKRRARRGPKKDKPGVWP